MRVIVAMLILLLALSGPVYGSVERERTIYAEGDVYFLTGVESAGTKVGTRIHGTGSITMSDALGVDGEISYIQESQFATADDALRRLEVTHSIISPFGVYATRITPERGMTGYMDLEVRVGEAVLEVNQASGVLWGRYDWYTLLTDPEAVAQILDDMRVRGRVEVRDYLYMNDPRIVEGGELNAN